jgi:hypothetical protein
MTHTTNYNLNKFESTDAVQNAVAALNSNMDIIDSAFGGMKLRKLTQTEYDALTVKDPDTLYTVTDGSKVTLYLGETELKSGSVTAGISALVTVGTSESSQGMTPTE